MRVSPRVLLATPVASTTGAGPLRQNPAALLPPIPLYRRILRSHRYRLQPEQRLVGDAYVKSEFRRHRKVDNPIHIIGFLTEWQLYAQALEGESWKDEKMDMAKIDKMSEEQLGQMYELMQALQRQADDEGNEGKD